MHISTNCYLLIPRWQSLTKSAQRENWS